MVILIAPNWPRRTCCTGNPQTPGRQPLGFKQTRSATSRSTIPSCFSVSGFSTGAPVRHHKKPTTMRHTCVLDPEPGCVYLLTALCSQDLIDNRKRQRLPLLPLLAERESLQIGTFFNRDRIQVIRGWVRGRDTDTVGHFLP